MINLDKLLAILALVALVCMGAFANKNKPPTPDNTLKQYNFTASTGNWDTTFSIPALIDSSDDVDIYMYHEGGWYTLSGFGFQEGGGSTDFLLNGCALFNNPRAGEFGCANQEFSIIINTKKVLIE